MITVDSFSHEEVLGIKLGYHPFAKPSMFVHTYFIDGLLIDTAQRLTRKKLLASTNDLPIEQIYVTHHHEDHSGNIGVLIDRHKCPVYASNLCCEMMKDPPHITFAQKITWGNRPAQKDLIPKEGIIETRNYSFEIIPIPGHAPDMVALYEPNRKWLFSADLYINSYISYMLDDESISTQIDSTKRIMELDFDVLFCAHKPKLEKGKQQLEKKLNFLESFYETVANLYQKGNRAEEIFNQLNLKEDYFVKALSGGYLSKMNMVKSVIRDFQDELKNG